jgi:hypothetical protein
VVIAARVSARHIGPELFNLRFQELVGHDQRLHRITRVTAACRDGTHVFTAMEYQSEGAAIRWTVVSIPEEFPRMSEGATKEGEAPARQTDKANAALNHIEIPQDTVERISELLTPASSLIISDNGFSYETGKDTDFIVITH